MDRKKVFNVLFTIVFAGLILSFSLYFTLTATMKSEYQIEDKYLNINKPIDRNVFSVFDDACLKNKNYYDLIKKAEFKVFGNIVNSSFSNVMMGQNDFLFSMGKNELGYNFVSDYLGEYKLSDENLNMIYQHIEMRRKAHEDHGRTYILAVIPNSQSVYSENYPSCFGDISDNTMLSQITKYLEKKQFKNFVNLTDTMLKAKEKGLLFNNTENSINALGAYYAYKEIYKAIPDDKTSHNRMLSYDFFDMYTHYTDGKDYAESAGIESIVKNKTVSISNTNKYFYTTVEFFKDLETTYTNDEYKDKVPLKPAVLLEFTNDWDKIQLMPYFSNTFGVSSYRTSQSYNKDVLENSNANIVIQVIHEDEIVYLLDQKIANTYEEGLQLGDNPYYTMRPKNVEYTLINNNRVVITGFAEKDSSISIFGDSINTVTVKEIGGRFISLVELKDDAFGRDILIRAKSENKIMSEPYIIRLLPQSEVKLEDSGVLIGSNSMLYSSSFKPAKMPNLDIINDYTENVRNDLQYMNNYLGKDVKVVYSIIPQKFSVYKTGAPARLYDVISDYENLRSVSRVAMMDAGVYTIDFSKMLLEKSENDKIFYQGYDALTDIAYYYMYQELMNQLCVENRFMTPIRIENFKAKDFKISVGNHFSNLGFPKKNVPEMVKKLTVTNRARYFQNGKEVMYPDMLEAFETRMPSNLLPKAIIVRNSNGTNMVDYMAEHFSEMYVLAEGQTEISRNLIEKVNPDYIIYLCDEDKINFEK